MYFLLEEYLLNEDEKVIFEKKLKEEYVVLEGVFNVLKVLFKEMYFMDGLCIGVLVLVGYDNDIENCLLEVNKS